MDQRFKVGFVKEVHNNMVICEMYEETNMNSYVYKGKFYSGIKTGSFVGIICGPNIVVCQIEKESLYDTHDQIESQKHVKSRYKRIISTSVVGSLSTSHKYVMGLKNLPKIYDQLILLEENEVSEIITSYIQPNITRPKIGELVFFSNSFLLNWENLFNTHIGIFGNTGSGKSNTLAKLYAELFKLNGNKIELGDSRFILLDFNGEYVGNEIFGLEEKFREIILLNSNKNNNKLTLSENEFWDIELLSLLYSATEKTQKPFLKNAKKYYKLNEDSSLINKIGTAFYNTYRINTVEAYNLLIEVYELIGIEKNFNDKNSLTLDQIPLGNCSWHSKYQTLISGSDYVNDLNPESLFDIRQTVETLLEDNIDILLINDLDVFDEVLLALKLRLLYEMYYQGTQYEFITPLINRCVAENNSLKKVIKIGEVKQPKLVKIISFKDCSIQLKKILPLVIAKQSYKNQKLSVKNKFESTTHLLIDEAHNILSESSNRETLAWKDYRLETFEELIKEGRKFGFYLTISSQRPSDISPTVMSQLHNYFIHRIINENDIRMLNNTISTLDFKSKQSLSTLGPGQCIVTGTSYQTPILVQFDQLEKKFRPRSDDADLIKIWKYNND